MQQAFHALRLPGWFGSGLCHALWLAELYREVKPAAAKRHPIRPRDMMPSPGEQWIIQKKLGRLSYAGILPRKMKVLPVGIQIIWFAALSAIAA